MANKPKAKMLDLWDLKTKSISFVLAVPHNADITEVSKMVMEALPYPAVKIVEIKKRDEVARMM